MVKSFVPKEGHAVVDTYFKVTVFLTKNRLSPHSSEKRVVERFEEGMEELSFVP